MKRPPEKKSVPSGPIARRRPRWTAWIAAGWILAGGFGSAGASPGITVDGRVLINGTPAEKAVVYLEDLRTPAGTPVPVEKTIIQEEFAFHPSFTMLPVGSTLRFENQDKEMHNVHSLTPGHRFDVGSHLPGMIKKTVLDRPGGMIIRCRIHPEMRGMVFVAPSNFFDRAFSGGRFEIPNVPPGRFRISVWHPRLDPGETEAAAVLLELDSEPQTLILEVKARAPEGAELVEVPRRKWSSVLEEIDAGLGEAVRRWKTGHDRAALRELMAVHARGYGKSGLQAVIVQNLGKDRDDEHEEHFNAVIRLIQKAPHGPEGEKAIRRAVEELLAGLGRDIRLLQNR